MKVCKNCGYEAEEQNKFCINCGDNDFVQVVPLKKEEKAQNVPTCEPNTQENTVIVSDNPYQNGQYEALSTQSYPAKVKKKTSGLTIAGFVLSILSFLYSDIVFFGLAIGLVGLPLAIIGLCKGKKKDEKVGLAIAGIILASLGIISSVETIIIWFFPDLIMYDLAFNLL